jgi:poly(ribitol-phosphate) beta-N-acetylglucosaminyltransferase
VTDISVVVVSCGNLSLTISCLSSLIEYTFNSAQILLIDNGSPETIKTFLEKFCQERGIDFISLHKNFGPGFARRIGLQHAKHEIVSFVDDDIVVTPNWDLFLVERLLCE